MNEKITKLCEDPKATFDELFDAYEREIKKHPEDEEMRYSYAIALFDFITIGFYRYSNSTDFQSDMYYKKLKKLNNFIQDDNLLNAAICIIERKNQEALSYIQSCIDDVEEINEITYDDFTYSFIIALKNGFKGMWIQIGKMLDKTNLPSVYSEMCDVLEVVYHSDKNEVIVDSILNFISKYPDVHVMKELLAYSYYEMGRWKESIAYFEQTFDLEATYIFREINVYFFLAYAYDSIKRYEDAETYYKKVLAINPLYEYANNNLAYVLYKQKKYNESKAILEKCIKDQLDGKFPYVNMANVLIALEEYEEVQEFVKKYDNKLPKAIKDKVKKIIDNPKLNTIENQSVMDSSDDANSRQSTIINLGVKKQQFSSEKILEDEIINRLEKGMPVFGFPLKIYERKGFYGRQFPIKNGRLDILTEDNNGDLWVIELKKDNGYGDVYQQITQYINYIKDNIANKGQKVFGIICLNNPDKKLMDKVKRTQNIRLFEYSINISEIR